MLFQQNYLPGAFPAERFYHQSQKHLQQQPPLPSFPQDSFSRVRPSHPELDSVSNSVMALHWTRVLILYL